jgi:tetratricopeptide (TPR) repeat protein
VRARRLLAEALLEHFTLALVLFTAAEKTWQTAPGLPEARQWFTEVLEHARRAAELKPDHAQAYLFWGLALKYLGRPAEAVAPLRQGVACRPENFELQLALGEALLLSGPARPAPTWTTPAPSTPTRARRGPCRG